MPLCICPICVNSYEIVYPNMHNMSNKYMSDCNNAKCRILASSNIINRQHLLHLFSSIHYSLINNIHVFGVTYSIQFQDSNFANSFSVHSRKLRPTFMLFTIDVCHKSKVNTGAKIMVKLACFRVCL